MPTLVATILKCHIAQSPFMLQLTVDLDNAFHLLIKRRKHFPPNSDIWHLRFHWLDIKPRIEKADCSTTVLWSSQDALAIKEIHRQTQSIFYQFGFQQHPAKTFINKIDKGFPRQADNCLYF